MNDDRFFDRLRDPCPVAKGARIRLGFMGDDPDPLPPGSLGTVTGGNGAQIYVDWDSGRSLILVVGVDRWSVVTTELPSSEHSGKILADEDQR